MVTTSEETRVQMRQTRFKGGGKRGQSYDEFFGFKPKRRKPFKLFSGRRRHSGCAPGILVMIVLVLLSFGLHTWL
jgi:hypothetical protein